MKHLKGKTAAALVLVLLMCLILGQWVWAHACKAESVGGTVVKFYYSDGTPVKGGRILVRDGSGETLGTGKTASDGTYDYAAFVGKAAVLYMNDGEGHAVEYEVPVQGTPAGSVQPAAGTGQLAGSDAKHTGDGAQPAETDAKNRAAESSPSISAAETDAAAGRGTDWLKIAGPVLAVAVIAVLILVLRRKRA